MVISTFSVAEIEEIHDRVYALQHPPVARDEADEEDAETDLPDGDRFHRRRKTASEMLEFDEKNKLGVAPPRTLLELSQALSEKPLIYEGLTVEHKVQLEMRRKEQDNYYGHTTCCVAGRNNALLYDVVCTEEGCEGGFCASFLVSQSHWRVKGTTPHTEECIKKAQSAEHKHSITPYTYLDLALVPELQQVANEDISVPCKKLQRYLALIIRGTLHRSKMLNLRQELQSQLFSTATEAVRDMPALMALLEKDGHTVDVKIVDKASMQAIILKQRRNQHENQQSKLPPAQRKRWADVCEEETKKAEEILQGHAPETQYVVGWNIVFRTGKAMIPHLIKVFLTDATFMRSKVGGALYCTVAPDANNGIVVGSISWFWGGENSMGWDTHADIFCQFIPPGARVIMDGNDAAMAAFLRCLQQGKPFMCSVHFAKNIGKGTTKKFYHQALKTPKQASFDALKANIPIEDYNQLVSKHGSERLFMRECGNLYGHHCQSMAESLNKALMDARKAPNHIGESIQHISSQMYVCCT